jgi:hypothetical protein
VPPNSNHPLTPSAARQRSVLSARAPPPKLQPPAHAFRLRSGGTS